MWNAGNQWSGYVAYLSFFRHVAKLDIDYSKFKYYETLTKFGPRFMHEDFCIISELPEGKVYRDAANRPHREDGPHIRWRDGWAIYTWHGVRVPAAWIEDKTAINTLLALTWPNIEQRRCLAEIVGWKRVLEQLKPKVIDTDADPEIGQLLEVDLPGSGKERFLRVLCGTKREFVLPTSRDMKTARQANARSYGLAVEQFNPEVRT